MTTTGDRSWWISFQPPHLPKVLQELSAQAAAQGSGRCAMALQEPRKSSLQKLGYKHKETPKKSHTTQIWPLVLPPQDLWMFAPGCFCSSWGWKGISLARSHLVSFFCSDPIVLKHNGAEFSIVPLGLHQNWNQHWKVCCVMLLPALNTMISAKKH